MGALQGLISDGGHLYAAWKGAPGDDQIYYSRRSGSGNWAHQALMGGSSSAGPSLGVFGGSVYAAWKGEFSDPRIFFAKFNGTDWEDQGQIPNAYSDVGPALCAFSSNQFVATWKSIDQSLWYAVYDSTGWSAPAQIAGVASSAEPSLAAYGGKLYAIWKGASDHSLWYASFDGGWSGQHQVPQAATSVGASLATVGSGTTSKLYAVWKGSSDETLWYDYYDGTWHGQNRIPGGGSSVGAAIAEFNGNLVAMATGKGTDRRLYTAEFSGTDNSWSGWTRTVPGNTGPDQITLLPAPEGGYLNYLLGNSVGTELTGATVTITVVEDIVPDNGGAYSFQINCNGPTQPSGAAPFVWQQYGFRIAGGQLFFWINAFRQQDLPYSNMINWDSRPPRLPLSQGVIALPNNRLPSGWQLTTTLTTDSNNNITGVSFNVAEPDGTVTNSGLVELLSTNTSVVADNLAPIFNFQVILVAENEADDGPADTINFSAGQGIFFSFIERKVDRFGRPIVQNLTASAAQRESAENSNIQYTALPTSYPNGEFYQFFGAPPT